MSRQVSKETMEVCLSWEGNGIKDKRADESESSTNYKKEDFLTGTIIPP